MNLTQVANYLYSGGIRNLNWNIRNLPRFELRRPVTNFGSGSPGVSNPALPLKVAVDRVTCELSPQVWLFFTARVHLMAKDYSLFLPLLVYRDGDFTKLAKLDRAGELAQAKEILTLDLEAVKYQAQTLYTRRNETHQNCFQFCLQYPDLELFNKAGLIYHLYLTCTLGYTWGGRCHAKDAGIRETVAALTSSHERELRYILHLILFHDLAADTLPNLVKFLLVGQPPMELAMSLVASSLLEFELVSRGAKLTAKLLTTLLGAYKANSKLRPYIRYKFQHALTFSGWVLAIISTFPHLADTVGFHLAGFKVSFGVIRLVPFSSLPFQLAFLNSLLSSHTHSLAEGVAEGAPGVGQVSIAGSMAWVWDRTVDGAATAAYFQRLLDDVLRVEVSLRQYPFKYWAADLSLLGSFLRVMTSFKAIYNFKLGVPPLSKLFAMLNACLPREGASRSFLDLCLGFVVVAGPEFLVDKPGTKDGLGEILEGLFNFHFEAIVHVVTAIRCNNAEALSAYYASVLGFSMSFDVSWVSRLRGLFSFAVFEAPTLADRICSVTSVDYSHRKMPLQQASQQISYLLGCGIKMIRDLEFRTNLPAWVGSLLANLHTLPIHNYLPALIKDYVECVTQDPQVPKIPEAVLAKRLHANHDDWGWEAGPREILFLYYALLFNERLVELSAASPDLVPQRNRAPFEITSLVKYSDGFYDQIPVKRIMRFVEENPLGPGMDGFKAEFCGLVRSTFAHFFGVTALVVDRQGPAGRLLITRRRGRGTYPTLRELKHLSCVRRPTLSEALEAAFAGAAEDPQPLQLMLEFLKAQPRHVLLSCADKLICQGIPALLAHPLPQATLDAYLDLWFAINNLAPEKLWPLTVNRAQFLPADASRVRLRDCYLQDLFDDPLLLARLNPNFFRIPQLFQIFITMVDSVSNASRSRFQRIFRYRTPKQKALFGMEEVWSMIHLQDTAVIQMVLELCQEAYHAKDLANLQSIRRMAFNFVHLQFVETPHYIRLVHFQTYPHDLIALAVENIPSLPPDVVTEFLSELVGHPDHAVRWFAILLASHVLAKYPLSSSLALVEDCIVPHLQQLVGRLNLITSVPEPERWEAHLLKISSQQSKEVIAEEISALKWAQNVIALPQLSGTLVRLATTFPQVAHKFLSWIGPAGITWEADPLKARLEGILSREEGRPTKRQRPNPLNP
ncbi:Integrator complex subunit 2 [Massospora cicadina]|nr:Integrator complex subunit 2 [Massospora cicadina]